MIRKLCKNLFPDKFILKTLLNKIIKKDYLKAAKKNVLTSFLYKVSSKYDCKKILVNLVAKYGIFALG